MTKKAEELGELTLYKMMDCYNLKEEKNRNYWSMAAKIMADELSIEVGRYIWYTQPWWTSVYWIEKRIW